MSTEKNNLVTLMSHAFGRIGEWSMQHRWVVFSIAVSLTMACIYLAGSVRMDNGFESFFDDTDPAYSAYLKYRDDFGSDEVAYLVYDAKDREKGVFDLTLMQTIQQLSEDIENDMPFVKDVKSMTNAEVMIGVDGGLEILRLDEDFPDDQATLDAFADTLMSKPVYINNLVSEDRRYGAVLIEMTASSIDPVDTLRLDPNGGDGLENLYPQASDKVLRDILSRPDYADLDIVISGDVPLNTAFNTIATKYMFLTFAMCFAAVAVLLLIFFRGKIIDAVGPMAVVFLSILMTVGFVSLIGWDIDMLFGMVPTLVVAVGVAHSVHIVSEFRSYQARLGNRTAALKQTFYLVGAPCMLTSLTTAAGFMSLAISPIKAIEHMAVYTAFAVIAAFFLSLTLLTFFLSFGKARPIEKSNKPHRMEAPLAAIARFNMRHPKTIVAVGLVAFAVMISGVTKIVVDSNFLLDFNEKVQVRQDAEHIDATMSGVGSLVYLFDAESADAIKDPAVLRDIEAFQAELDQQPLTRKTLSIVDLIKDINQSFHNGDPAYHTIPDDQTLIAQYLLVYELSGGEELANYVSTDYARAALDIRIPMTATSEMAALKSAMTEYDQQHPQQQSEATFSGMGALWMQLVDYISRSQVQGIMLAFVVITAIMCLIFRSFKVGIISMVPNLLPALAAVGLIGWIGVPLDYMKLMIAPVALGIAVDDTIHMMTRLHHEFRQRGNYNEALEATMKDVGRALVITSIVLITGFMFLTISPMDSQFWFGLLLSTTILLALVADFFIMPSLVLLTKPFGAEFDPADTADSANRQTLQPTV
ncbi:Uncharacterised protein [BD1-7 clade bacterium]|uniref:SSD domain-containing protein n=1 Tax=BD1-7 clade bacterium TaxID=2029982 RepID=A0A5S9PE24_9GAMM|nr:Uncharacterised protein [BD1-7 clade bacterium]